MPGTTMTMHSIDDNTGGSLGVMRHVGGVYLVIDDEGRTAAAGPFARAQLDELLDELAPVGRSTGPHVHHAVRQLLGGPGAVTGEMVERAQDRGRELLGVVWDHEVVEAMIVAALTEPGEDPEVVALAEALGDFAVADEHNGTRDDMQLARLLHGRGVRVGGSGR